jgi:ABC-2 type transport system ATP-binding protein
VIEALGLSRRFGGRDAIRDVSFAVRPGEVVGFLGQNGAGKTTTLRTLAGLSLPSGGVARVGGHDVVRQARAARACVGFLAETAPVYPEVSVRAQVGLAASLRGLGAPEVDAALTRLDLRAVAERPIAALSKGWRQRVALAAAIVHRPRALLLDEPMSGLDPGQRRAVRALVRELADEGAAVIVSSHALGEVEEGCDRVLLLHQGHLRADVALAELRGERVRVRAERSDGLGEALARVPGVTGVTALPGPVWELQTEGEVRAAIAAAAVPFGLLELSTPRRLEELWLGVVGEG